MALIPKLRQEELDEFGDITSNLESLQFESALTDEEKDLLHLRARAHAITVSACAQATYFTSIFNESRQIQLQLLTPDHMKKSSRLLNDGASQDPLLIGIIGCGRLGSHIAHCLLTFGEVNPHELKISTRRPETLSELQNKGVLCVHNNRDVAASVHLLFLCVLPAQLQTVAEEIKGHIPKNMIVYSFTSALTAPRVQQLLDHKQVLMPVYRWDESRCRNVKWDYTMEVTGMFANHSTLELTCPLSLHKHDSPIITDEKFCVEMACALANFHRSADLTKREVTNILNAVLLGHSSKEQKEEILEPEDLCESSDRQFPVFDLCKAAESTSLVPIFKNNFTLRQYAIDKYCGLFQHYLEWKNQSLQLTKKPMSLST